MLKSFFKNNLIYSLGNILTMGISIFLLPIYTKYLSPNEFGIIDLFMVIGTFVNLTIALEISQGLARYYQEAKSNIEKKHYTSSAFWFTILIYLFFFVFSFTFRDILSSWLLGNENEKKIFILALLAIVTNGIFIFTQNQLKWQMKAENSVKASLVYFTVLASVTIYLLVVQGFKVESIFIGQISGNIIASLVAIYFARKSYELNFSITKFKEMISYSSPLVLSSIGVIVGLYIDRIAIRDLLGFEELGIYGVAFRFTAIAGLVIIGFQHSLTPLIFKNYKKKKTPLEISKIFNVFVILALLVVAMTILFSKEIVILFTAKIFYNASNLITVLIIAVFFSNMHIFSPGLPIAKKTKLIALIALFGAILNTILNYTLIPMLGLSGAAYATLISSITSFIIYLFFSNKYYPLPYQFKKQIISLTIVLISTYSVVSIFDEVNLISIFIKTIYLLFVFVLTIYLLMEKKYLHQIRTNIIGKKISN